MKFYFAPMEGITGYQYRNAHHELFDGIDKYFTPFIVPTQNNRFSSREKNDVIPEHNEGLYVVPQILTNKAEGFIWVAKELNKSGYKEVNLNLGCPSKTVVSKNKGSGFLACREELNLFLHQIFSELNMKISVKTRIGRSSPDEFGELLQIFNRYPLEELIIHPRIQSDFYENTPNLQVYAEAVSLSTNPVCYNGDIFEKNAYAALLKQFPGTDRIMLGRGLIANPALAETLEDSGCLDKKRFLDFHNRILEDYRETISGDRNLLFKMKELWIYMGALFPESEKYIKRIRKAERLDCYQETVSALLRDCELMADRGYRKIK